ncbi:hypothetical protein ABT404_43540 [Streptomyces hyaluromycini]|uniref:Uncharacterized protein n=1 Tax=Streptomyces hyaluromycini TaxID=1377993 RepID=A0ABV1XB42_9ACTN
MLGNTPPWNHSGHHGSIDWIQWEIRAAADPRHAEGRQVAFYAGDDAGAKAAVADVLSSFGFAALDLGGLRDGGRLMQLDGPLSGRHLLLQDVG